MCFDSFRLYDCRQIPVRIEHHSPFNCLSWRCQETNKVNTDTTTQSNLTDNLKDKLSIDFHRLVPIFIFGLFCPEDPYRFVAVQGTNDILSFVPEEMLNEGLMKETAAGFKGECYDCYLDNLDADVSASTIFHP